MEGKDNRSRAKRSKMNQHHRKLAQRATVRNNTSSSDPVSVVRAGVIDVADSSDETVRRGWISSCVPSQQRNLDLLIDNPDVDDLDEDDVGTAQMRAGDFNLMSQLPTSVGGHFQFSSEKNWDSTEGEQLLDSTEASAYFTLNLKLLNVGLQTIPFYKRMDYPASMFTREQVLSMEKAAEVAEKNYQNVLKEHETNPPVKVSSGTNRSGSAKSQATVKAAPGSAGANDKPDELDELLNMTATQVSKVNLNGVSASEQPAVTAAPDENITATADGNKDDIQQWLDNVLEE